MRISIVTPVLNGERFIGEAVASLQAQSYQDFEHITVDGGSTDGTTDIITAVACEDERFRLVTKSGCSQYQAIDIGFSQASGDIIAWLNADDMYTPWAFTAVARRFAQNAEISWLSGLPSCWDESGELVFVQPRSWWPQRLIRAGWFHEKLLGYIQQESLFFRRALYLGLSQAERETFTQARLAGDFMLWRFFAKRSPLEALPTVLGGFRRHDANRSTAVSNAYWREVLENDPFQLPQAIAGRLRGLYVKIAASKAAHLSIKYDAEFTENFARRSTQS
ncbi:MAG: glycosyltransferase [Pseudomonadota bacterium]